MVDLAGKIPNQKMEEGDFSFVKDPVMREMMEDLFNAIHVANAWDYMMEGPKGLSFSMSMDPELFEIARYAQYKYYSAVSYDFIMEKMQRIALYGWKAFVEHWKSIEE